MPVRFSELVIDCIDPMRLATFWQAVLDWELEEDEEDGEVIVELTGPAGSGPTLLFVPVPEPKTVKDRIHIDVSPVGTDQATELERLLALGAVPVDVGQKPEHTWVVLADPEGNEFCLLGPHPSTLAAQ